MPLSRTATKPGISQNIREMVQAGHPQRQAVAAALHMADEVGGIHRASGGFAPVSGDWAAHQAARNLEHETFHQSGLFPGNGSGRTDRLARSVPADSFVFPSDVVSALGQGHTAAGGKILDGMMGSGPYHTPLASKGSKIGGGIKFAKGGDAQEGDDGVSHVLVASGEYLAPRDAIARIGGLRRRAGMSKKNDDLSAGHEWARQLVDRVRKSEINRLKTAPKPKA